MEFLILVLRVNIFKTIQRVETRNPFEASLLHTKPEKTKRETTYAAKALPKHGCTRGKLNASSASEVPE
jgi:hypothetical protein